MDMRCLHTNKVYIAHEGLRKGSYLVVDHVRPLLPHGIDGLEDVHFSLHFDSLHLTHCRNEHTRPGHAITDRMMDTGRVTESPNLLYLLIIKSMDMNNYYLHLQEQVVLTVTIHERLVC